MQAMPCPCQSGESYANCCQALHQGQAAPTAEALMRSRYSAYVLDDAAYLHRSWSKQTRPPKKSLQQTAGQDWQGLRIVATEQGGLDDKEGIVEFIAYYRHAGQDAQLHERSRFVRENGRWVM